MGDRLGGGRGERPGRGKVCQRLTQKPNLASLSLPSALVPAPGCHGSQAWRLTSDLTLEPDLKQSEQHALRASLRFGALPLRRAR